MSESRLAAEALRIRRWALDVLAGVRTGRVPSVSYGAWELFLWAERCALPLERRLAGTATEGMSPEVAALLRGRATHELQCALSLQGQLRLVGRLLAENGWDGVALKSAAELVRGGEPLEAADVDILVRPEHVERLTRGMERHDAYRVVGRDPTPGSSHWTAAARAAPESVSVELHVSVPYLGADADLWEGRVATAVPGIACPAAELHLWHVLIHGAVHHPERRGRLRDLVLLAAAFGACTPEEIASVRRRVAAHPQARVLTRALDAAEAAASGTPSAVDPFLHTAALRLLSAGRQDGVRLFRVASALAEGDGGYRGLWTGSEWAALVPRGFRGGTALDRWSPAVARIFWTAARSVRLAALTPLGWRLSRQAARCVRAAGGTA